METVGEGWDFVREVAQSCCDELLWYNQYITYLVVETPSGCIRIVHRDRFSIKDIEICGQMKFNINETRVYFQLFIRLISYNHPKIIRWEFVTPDRNSLRRKSPRSTGSGISDVY